jgi:hypothetical protein
MKTKFYDVKFVYDQNHFFSAKNVPETEFQDIIARADKSWFQESIVVNNALVNFRLVRYIIWSDHD